MESKSVVRGSLMQTPGPCSRHPGGRYKKQDAEPTSTTDYDNISEWDFVTVCPSKVLTKSRIGRSILATWKKKNGDYRHPLTGKGGGKQRSTRVTIRVASQYLLRWLLPKPEEPFFDSTLAAWQDAFAGELFLFRKHTDILDRAIDGYRAARCGTYHVAPEDKVGIMDGEIGEFLSPNHIRFRMSRGIVM